MLIDVVMPQLGESVVEGVVVKWLVEAGELVARDQPLLEISTDKVDAEIPSPAAGRVAQMLAKTGETVPVQTVLARIETDQGAALPAGEPPKPQWDEETEGVPGDLARKSGPPIPAPPRVEPSAPPSPPRSPLRWSVVVTTQRAQGFTIRSRTAPHAISCNPSSPNGGRPSSTRLGRNRSIGSGTRSLVFRSSSDACDTMSSGKPSE